MNRDYGGSQVKLRNSTPITALEGSRDFGPFPTLNSSFIGGDIKADQACTLQVIRIPDADAPAVLGEASDTLVVPASTPKTFGYSQITCDAAIVRVTNTSGSDMTSFTLVVRGGGE